MWQSHPLRQEPSLQRPRRSSRVAGSFNAQPSRGEETVEAHLRPEGHNATDDLEAGQVTVKCPVPSRSFERGIVTSKGERLIEGMRAASVPEQIRAA